MRSALLPLLVLTTTLMSLTPLAARAADPAGVAVVELFTSEGCSSCPPADAALADLIKDRAGQRVYALAFHVDYWDSLGWTDPFSAAAYTRRQEGYGQAFRLEGVYTPQAVVNGRRELLGSDRATLKQAVDAALQEPAVGTLKAVALTQPGGKVKVDLTAAGLPAGATVNVAVVQRGISSVVPRGENGGRTLTHENVVRAFATVTPDAAGHVTSILPTPADARSADLRVIAFAVRPGDGCVIAATDAGLR